MTTTHPFQVLGFGADTDGGGEPLLYTRRWPTKTEAVRDMGRRRNGIARYELTRVDTPDVPLLRWRP